MQALKTTLKDQVVEGEGTVIECNALRTGGTIACLGNVRVVNLNQAIVHDQFPSRREMSGHLAVYDGKADGSRISQARQIFEEWCRFSVRGVVQRQPREGDLL